MSFLGDFGELLQTYTITRSGVGSVVNGMYVYGSSVTFPIQASIQPPKRTYVSEINDRDMDSKSLREEIWIYTNTVLKLENTEDKIKADVISYNGKDYEIKELGKWEGLEIDYYKYVALLVS